MKILVYGAGIIGSVYAARLQEAGYDVSLLARGQRALSLQAQGIQLENVSTKQHSTTHVTIVEHLAPTDNYDVVLVTVRLDHLASILPDLAANQQIPTIVFLLNNPDGMQRLEMLDPQRVILGFPSIGGSRVGDVIRYYQAPAIVPTTLGKEDGHITPRLRQLATVFKQAGFPVAFNSDMTAWLKTHSLFNFCLLTAVKMTNGNAAQLGRTRKNVKKMIQATREGIRAFEAQDIPISPFILKIFFLWTPLWLTIFIWQRILQTSIGPLAIDPGIETAFEEIRQMAQALKPQLQKSPIATPILNHFMSIVEIPA